MRTTHRGWSLPEDSAALTASSPTLSRRLMKCLPDFRLVASFCNLHCNDNHPGLATRSVFELSIPADALRRQQVRVSVPARRRNLTKLPHPIFASRRLAPVSASIDNRVQPLRLAPFSVSRFTLRTSFAFLASPVLLPIPDKMLLPAPQSACTDYGFRKAGCKLARVPGRNQSRSPTHSAIACSAF